MYWQDWGGFCGCLHKIWLVSLIWRWMPSLTKSSFKISLLMLSKLIQYWSVQTNFLARMAKFCQITSDSCWFSMQWQGWSFSRGRVVVVCSYQSTDCWSVQKLSHSLQVLTELQFNISRLYNDHYSTTRRCFEPYFSPRNAVLAVTVWLGNYDWVADSCDDKDKDVSSCGWWRWWGRYLSCLDEVCVIASDPSLMSATVGTGSSSTM